jgi:hypothetical protein
MNPREVDLQKLSVTLISNLQWWYVRSDSVIQIACLKKLILKISEKSVEKQRKYPYQVFFIYRLKQAKTSKNL